MRCPFLPFLPSILTEAVTRAAVGETLVELHVPLLEGTISIWVIFVRAWGRSREDFDLSVG